MRCSRIFLRWLANLLKVTVPRQGGTYIFLSRTRRIFGKPYEQPCWRGWKAVHASTEDAIAFGWMKQNPKTLWHVLQMLRSVSHFQTVSERLLVFFSLICFAFLALVLFSTPFGLAACTAMEKKETLWETIVTIRQNDSRRHCSTTSWCFYFFSLVFAIRSVGQPFSSTHL